MFWELVHSQTAMFCLQVLLTGSFFSWSMFVPMVHEGHLDAHAAILLLPLGWCWLCYWGAGYAAGVLDMLLGCWVCCWGAGYAAGVLGNVA